ncbi:MAG: DUF1801 domain-containing protein [Polyangiaceae bacterium]|nr:DUF1801 domain-containing protein [Polyangiaceae bacterium]
MATRPKKKSPTPKAKPATKAVRASKDENQKEAVDAFLAQLDHPMKAEIEAVRAIILRASPNVRERIKWNAPSFFFREDIGAFHLRSRTFVHLILVFPEAVTMVDDPILEGDHVRRREVKFRDMADVGAKKRSLQRIIAAWVADMEAS